LIKDRTSVTPDTFYKGPVGQKNPRQSTKISIASLSWRGRILFEIATFICFLGSEVAFSEGSVGYLIADYAGAYSESQRGRFVAREWGI